YQGGTRGAARCPSVDQRRLRPRVLDALRHAYFCAHFGGIPVSVRHRTDPRLCDDAVLRADVEPVHVNLRFQDALRDGARAPASGRVAVNLAVMHLFKDTKIDFLRWRWQAIALSWVIIIAGAVMFWRVGIPLGIEFAGGTELVMQFDRDVSVDEVR